MSTLEIRPDNKTINLESESSLEMICQENAASVVFGCRNGSCGSCLIRVVEGENNLSPKTPQEQQTLNSINAASNERLACQCEIFNNGIIEVVE